MTPIDSSTFFIKFTIVFSIIKVIMIIIAVITMTILTISWFS
jgi:hypothetical protein